MEAYFLQFAIRYCLASTQYPFHRVASFTVLSMQNDAFAIYLVTNNVSCDFTATVFVVRVSMSIVKIMIEKYDVELDIAQHFHSYFCVTANCQLMLFQSILKEGNPVLVIV
jgi:hypothetical protein